MNRSLLPMAALAGLIALTGCAELGYANGRYGDYGDYRRAPVPSNDGQYGRRSSYHGNVERDARQYVDQLDRHIRMSNREERQVRDLLVQRTYQLLDQTAYNRHGSVYPFPRSYGEARGWWARIDRDIERILDRRYHEPYRYYNRYGSSRYNDYYRHRRYDTRRGWYDTRSNDRRYEDGRRDDRRAAERRAEDRRRDRQQDRSADRRQDRREDARRDNRQDRRQDARRDNRQDRRQEARRDNRQDRRQDARQDRRERNNQPARTNQRRSDRETSRASDRRRASRDADRSRGRNERSDRRRRGDNDDDD